MKKTKRTHSAEFKAKVALEAIRGEKLIHEIAEQYQVHPMQVSDWKAQMLKGAVAVFEKPSVQKNKEQQAQVKEERLERKIGQLVVEVDWLSKKCKELGIEI